MSFLDEFISGLLPPPTAKDIPLPGPGEVILPPPKTGPRTVGRAREEDIVVYERDLVEADLAFLETDRGGFVPTLKKLRDSHHRIAQLMASGLRPMEVAEITGYTPSRLSIFSRDPAFQELLAYYREQYRDGAKAAAVDLTGRMTSFLTDAVNELHERLDADGEAAIGTGSLIDAIKVIADRAGYGPTTKSVNVNVDIATRLAAARRRIDLEPADE